MTNVFLLCILLLHILFPYTTSAGPRSTGPLSQQLSDLLPPCAHTCLRSVIESFRTSECRDPQSLQCLCTKKSASGFTLGEGALTCVASTCPPATFRSYERVYGVCLGIENARPMSYGTLTASQVLTTVVTRTRQTPPPNRHHRSMASEEASYPSEISFSSANSITDPITDPESIITSDVGPFRETPVTTSELGATATVDATPSLDSSSSPKTTSTSIHSSSTSLILSSSTFSTTASETSAVLPSASDTAPAVSSHPLSKGQVAGVVVAGIVSASLAFGLLFFFLCFRRKKPNKRDSGSSFGNDKEVNFDGDTLQSASYMTPIPGYATQPNSVEQTPQMQQRTPPSNRKSNRFSSILRRSIRPEDIGVALAASPKTPLMHDAEPPMSAATYRPPSQLLPEAPLYSLHPQSRGLNAEVSPISPTDPYPRYPTALGLGLSELHGTSSRNIPAALSELDSTPLAPQTGFLPLRISTSDPVLDSRRHHDSVFHPEMSRAENMTTWTRSTDTLRKPVAAARIPPRHPLRAQRSRGSLQPRSTPPSASSAMHPSMSVSALTTLPSQQRAASVQPISPPAHPLSFEHKASVTRQSTTSETDFEDTGSDDESPPLPEFPKPGTGPVKASTGPQRFVNAAAMLQNSRIAPEPQRLPRRTPRQYIPPTLTPSVAPVFRGVTTTTITAAPPGAAATPPLPLLDTTRAIIPASTVAELAGSAVSSARREMVAVPTTPSSTMSMSPGMSSPRTHEGRDVRRSAKWKLLVGSGEAGGIGTGVVWCSRGPRREKGWEY